MTTPFELSSAYVDELAELDPVFSTGLGLPGRDHRWGDLSTAGYQARAALAQRYRAALAEHAEHPDPAQRLAVEVLTASLGEVIDGVANGDHFHDLNHMASTFQRPLVSVFQTMGRSSRDDWAAICGRLETIGEAFDGYRSRLDDGLAAGEVVARRQVESVIAQAEALAGDDSQYRLLLADAHRTGFDEITGRLSAAVDGAREAAAGFGTWLGAAYLPHARPEDAVGEERYRRAASRLVGMDVDPHEAYAWAWEEHARLRTEMERVAADIEPGASLQRGKEILETDPDRAAHSPEDFIEFIQGRQQRALEQLGGVHFNVPEAAGAVTVQMAPPGGPLGAWYTRPSEDFSRPGGIWYALGDQPVIPLYHHVSTAYHEGFPGHHLQISTAIANVDRISRAQRFTIWYPGYGEGWGLYAELLMDELGFLETPDYRFGMLAKHLYRASRVVVDIGLHLGLRVPDQSPVAQGEPWTFDLAVKFMEEFGFRTPDQARSEVTRYLGWPGQAIAYALGEREMLRIRKEAERRAGDAFDLTAFHDRILGHGTMRFDTLRKVVLGHDRTVPSRDGDGDGDEEVGVQPVVTFRSARPDECDELIALMRAGIAHWGHDVRFPDLVADLFANHAPTADYIRESPVTVLEVDGVLTGFYGLEDGDEYVELLYMFLERTSIGQGLGRVLWEHAVATARRIGTRMRIVSDPKAVGFYAAMGATHGSDHEVTPGFTLRTFWFDLDSDRVAEPG